MTGEEEEDPGVCTGESGALVTAGEEAGGESGRQLRENRRAGLSLSCCLRISRVKPLISSRRLLLLWEPLSASRMPAFCLPGKSGSEEKIEATARKKRDKTEGERKSKAPEKHYNRRSEREEGKGRRKEKRRTAVYSIPFFPLSLSVFRLRSPNPALGHRAFLPVLTSRRGKKTLERNGGQNLFLHA